MIDARHCRKLAPACPALAALLFAATTAEAASPMRFDRLGLDEGLSEQAVNVIAQDASGFLWIGTEDGLNRYDGYQFQHFTHDLANPGSVPNNFIADLHFDTAGQLWVATDGGGVVWRDPALGRFTALDSATHAGGVDGLDRVRVVHTDRHGRLWIGSRDSGLAMFDPATSLLRRFKHSDSDPTSLIDNSILAILEDRAGRLWIGTDNGVDVLEPATTSFRHHRLSEQADRQQGRSRVRALLEDFRGTIWMGTDSGLEGFDPHTGATVQFSATANDPHSLPRASIEALYEDREHRLWIGTTDGLARFDREHRAFDTYRNDPRDSESLPDNHVVSLFEDRSGLLWVGTKFGGIAKWNPRSWSFGHRLADAQEGFASRNIMSFTEDREGRLWIGTFGGGLTALDPSGSRALTLRANDPREGGLTDDRVMALMTDRGGSVWVGTMGGGLDRISAGTHATTHFRHDPTDPGSLAAVGVMSLLEDSKGRIWVGTYGGGLSRLDRGATSFHTYLPDADDPTRLSNGRVTALAEDRSGRIWAGTDGGGLNILDPRSGDLIRLRHNFKDRRSLSADTVYALYIDAFGSVWIGTRGGGLDRATVSAGENGAIELSNVSEANGLPNNTVYGILADSSGRLWLSTNHGLACLDPRTGSISSYHRSHGLQADEFNFGAHYRMRDGRLLFGGANGYNVFHPDRLQFNRIPPPVALTTILKIGRPMRSDGSYNQLHNLHFNYRDDVITFEFAALDFAAPGANSFQYRLEGFDRSWIHTAGSLRSATYTHLPGGQYTLHVRAANADGVWNTDGLRLALDVDPPPWKTWWAYTLYALVGALLVYGAWLCQRRALARVESYRSQLEREVADRTRDLAGRNSELLRANSTLEEVSFTDALTGLGNRRSLDDAMPALIAGLSRNTRRDADSSLLALLLVDLDRLKPINDQHGHEAGDRLLIEVASILNECVRASHKVVRWGGDEFVVVHAVSDLEGAAAIAERIRYSVSKRGFKVGGTVDGRTSCSIGFALYPFIPGTFPSRGWEKVLSVADANLYRAKATRNAWVGCCGTHHAVNVPGLETLAARDLDSAERNRYVDVRRSTPADGETVELLLRKPSPANTRK
ncbi:MAG TPA: two-component regulator propeller domain-containing protein [Steroidobacteraceae bacterium]|nr:two-component regulator propeller domain-containing protein [Steroidobacteraceae bacterium]